MLKAEKVHFVAIGGYGMSGLALALLKAGVQVSGSDMTASSRTETLIAAGAKIHIGGHHAELVVGADVVVYSTQIPDENPELQAARARGIPVMHRSELLAAFINTGIGIAVTGTHGKTTTTTMIALLFERNGLDPTIFVGGEMEVIGGTGKVGEGPHVVAEADESDRSFLRYYPHVAVVTNIEPEHLEFWNGTFSSMVDGFRQFLGQIQPGGLAVLCTDDEMIRGLAAELRERSNAPRILSYGCTVGADWEARNIRRWEKGIVYECVYGGHILGEIRLPVPGRHNALNSLAALAVGHDAGLTFEQMCQTLNGFHNARRRYQVWAQAHGITVVDDYAHHPTEVKATLAAAKEQGCRRLVVVFQPQRYSRTAQFMEQFSISFRNADHLVLTSIYSPPGEQPIPGVTSEVLASRIETQTGREVHLVTDKREIVEHLLAVIRPGDTVLTMGAGDIWVVAQALAERLQKATAVSHEVE